jgi:hypothetical protein
VYIFERDPVGYLGDPTNDVQFALSKLTCTDSTGGVVPYTLEQIVVGASEENYALDETADDATVTNGLNKTSMYFISYIFREILRLWTMHLRNFSKSRLINPFQTSRLHGVEKYTHQRCGFIPTASKWDPPIQEETPGILLQTQLLWMTTHLDLWNKE